MAQSAIWLFVAQGWTMTTLADGYRYARPSTLEEALALMGEAGAMVLAGGQTLIPRLVAGIASPRVLVDLGGLGNLKQIEMDGFELTIGAMVSLAEVIQSPALRRHCPLLPQAAERTATPSIRNRGTLIGNLAWADAASQLPVVALAIDAVFRIARSGAYRVLPAQAFFSAPNRTALADDEMVTHLHFKTFPDRTGSGISDVALRQNSRALATAAAVITVDTAGRLERASLAVGGCGDVPRRCPLAESNLIGSPIADAPGIAAAALRAHPPQKGEGVLDAEYAIAVLPVLLRNAVRDACSTALT
jgi:aerobic carbon-monoxide dehydrogenase medium subunit